MRRGLGKEGATKNNDWCTSNLSDIPDLTAMLRFFPRSCHLPDEESFDSGGVFPVHPDASWDVFSDAHTRGCEVREVFGRVSSRRCSAASLSILAKPCVINSRRKIRVSGHGMCSVLKARWVTCSIFASNGGFGFERSSHAMCVLNSPQLL